MRLWPTPGFGIGTVRGVVEFEAAEEHEAERDHDAEHEQQQHAHWAFQGGALCEQHGTTEQDEREDDGGAIDPLVHGTSWNGQRCHPREGARQGPIGLGYRPDRKPRGCAVARMMADLPVSQSALPAHRPWVTSAAFHNKDSRHE